MKHLAKLMLLTLGIGVVAVVLLSLPRHTAAAAGDSPPNLVSLWFGSGATCTTGGFQQRLPSGALSPTTCYAVPAGKYLVVTDVAYNGSGGTPGGELYFYLDFFTGPGAYISNKQLDLTGSADGHATFTTGIVFDHNPLPLIFCGPPTATSCAEVNVTLPGYLLP